MQKQSRVVGRVASVSVSDNQIVQPGNPLLQIEPEPYARAVETAPLALRQALQSLGVSTAWFEAAQAASNSALALLVQARGGRCPTH